MAMKRKRVDRDASTHKKPKPCPSHHDSPVQRDLLGRCYPQVTTLRAYVLSKLPSSSRIRRKKIASLDQHDSSHPDIAPGLVNLLDTTIVCSQSPETDAKDTRRGTRWDRYLVYSQQDDSQVTPSESSALLYSQKEVSIPSHPHPLMVRVADFSRLFSSSSGTYSIKSRQSPPGRSMCSAMAIARE